MESCSQLLIQCFNSKTLTLTLPPQKSLSLHDIKRSLFPNIANLCYFTLNGRIIGDQSLLPDPESPSPSTLVLHLRVSGGGGDGGATGAESRDCYLKMYAEKKPDKVDPNMFRLSKWLNCALTNEPLRQPCVVDLIGNVFNKETLVEALISKNLPKEFGHIRGLKDMINIKLEPTNGTNNATNSSFCCPITGLEFNGKYKFFALRRCGHVLSSKALKEIQSSTCLVCHKEFDESDKIPINGSDDEVATLRSRMMEERPKIADKKARKVKNGGTDTCGDDNMQLVRKFCGDKHDALNVDGGEEERKVSGFKTGNAVGGGAKRFRAVDIAPAKSNKDVYASIFNSSKKSDFKETFTCRSLPIGRN